MDAVRSALHELIDYAGLFPPASRPLDAVIRNYARYRADDTRWMLGRLIVPAARLAELSGLLDSLGAGGNCGEPWRISALVRREDLAGEVERVQAFNAHKTTAARVDAIECIAASAAEVAAVAEGTPASLERFLEIPADPDPSTLMSAIRAAGCHAKIRMGGVTGEAFPSPETVARFLARAVEAGVALKATAGLHHPIRGPYRLTYEANAPTGIMHGFVNLVLAATLLASRQIDEEHAAHLLDDDRPEAFSFGGRAASWLNAVVTFGEIEHARKTVLTSVGSCSFEEPVGELTRVGWI
jgi:hypothetical protein